MAWDPETWEYHFQLGIEARQTESAADQLRATAHLREAARLNPLSWTTWIELAQAAEDIGKTGEAEDAYLQATRLNPRSARYQWLTGRFYLTHHRGTRAADFFRHAVELEPSYRLEWIELLEASGVREEVIEAAWPPDRDSKLKLLQTLLGQDHARRTAILERQWENCLAASRFPTLREGAFYVNHLFDGQLFDRAWNEWVRLVQRNSPEKKEYLGGEETIWNGDFEEDFSGARFDWEPEESRNFSISRSPGAGVGRSAAARISFHARGDLSFDGLRQSLCVEAGGWYEFSLWMKADRIKSEQGVFFQFVTLPDRSVLLQTGEILGSHDWTRLAGIFKVPEGSRIIALEVRRKQSQRPDHPITGVLTLDNVSLRKTDRSGG